LTLFVDEGRIYVGFIKESVEFGAHRASPADNEAQRPGG
jgi:hypothetical protein